MKKKAILLGLHLFLTSLCVGIAQGQHDFKKSKFDVGIKLGGGISAFSDPIAGGFAPGNISLNGGLALYIPITSYRFSLQSEITYNWRYFTSDSYYGTEEDDYRINTIEIPIILNTRLFEYDSNSGRCAVNLLTGLGYARGLKSKIITTDYDNGNYYRYEYVSSYTYTVNQYGGTTSTQESNDFADVRKNNLLLIIGVNKSLLVSPNTTIGLRYTKFLKSIYELDQKIDDYDFTITAFCISFDVSAYF